MTQDALIAAAGALMAQYGAEAEVIATLRAAEHAALGDLEASDFWMAVAELTVGTAAGAKPDS